MTTDILSRQNFDSTAYKEQQSIMPSTKHLDVGCGLKPRNPFDRIELYGIDIVDQQDTDFYYTKCNVLLEKLPFDEATFDSISCYDFLEHIPRLSVEQHNTRFPFVEFMNEVYRVLKPGGLFYVIINPAIIALNLLY